ncbi:MAG: YaaA family protein [Saprospiraceae bacterium]
MIAILSPAKRMDVRGAKANYTLPQFLPQAEELMNKLKTLKSVQLQKLMDISKKLADLNVERNFNFNIDHNNTNSTQSIFSYKGDVYVGLEAETFDNSDIEFAQNHLRILSGLYGIIRPLDLIQEYRLEMGTKLKIGRKKDLYNYWGNLLTENINNSLSESNSELLINLASDEYYKALDEKKIKGEILKIQFREYQGDKLKFISFNTKKSKRCNGKVYNKK